jgi:hypothetical protein
MASSAKSGSQLRDLLREAGCTYESMAREICQIARERGDRHLRANRSSVAQWVAGARPAPQTQIYLAEALSRRLARPVTGADLGLDAVEEHMNIGLELTGDPVRTVSSLASADLDRRSFLTTAAFSAVAMTGPLDSRSEAVARTTRSLESSRNPLVGARDVTAVHQLTADLNALDEKYGGQYGRDTVVMYLGRDITMLCRGPFSNKGVRDAMFSAAAQVAYLAGWKSHDAGLESHAQRYYLQACDLARESDTPAHEAYILRILAHHALDVGRRDHVTELAEEAWRLVKDHGDPQTLSLFALNLARAYAAVGDSRRCARWLLNAEALAAKPIESEPPSWAALGGTPEARLASQRARTFTALGRHADAEPLYARATNRWGPTSHPRIRALDLYALGRAQALQGHLEQACHTWSEAVPMLRSVRSARTIRALSDIHATLAAPRHRNTAAARRLMELSKTSPAYGQASSLR